MLKLDPQMCGKWDGCGLWLQWNQVDDSTEFELQVRYGRGDASLAKGESWGPWVSIVPPQGARSHWGVVPTWKEGWLVSARVRIAGSDDAAWESAKEVTFERCWARFEIASVKYNQYFSAGTIFHAQVDGAACAYQTRQEISVRPGEKITARLFAMGSSGYFQLDKENDFDVRPTFGVRVRNIEASVDDVKATGRDFTVIEGRKPDPVTMTVTPATQF